MSGEKKPRISREQAVMALRTVSHCIKLVGVNCKNPVELEHADELITQVITEHLAFPEGLQQLGPFLSCVSCGHLAFDGREELPLDIDGDGSDVPPATLE